MLKRLRVDTEAGTATLLLALTSENLERLPREPIGFEPRSQLAPMFVQCEGRMLELTGIGIIAGDSAATLPLAELERVQ